MDDNFIVSKRFLTRVGMPTAQQADICVLSILALAGIKPGDSWKNASNEWMRIHDIIQFANCNYGTSYAENSRETFRKQAMHEFRTAALIEDNGSATNSPNYRYRLTEEALRVIRTLNSSEANNELEIFLAKHETLKSIYASKKNMALMPVHFDGSVFNFSPGKHNELQKAILEEFAPRFAGYSECLYVGDSTDRDLVNNVSKMEQLGFNINVHNKMPDIILYRADKDWIYFIEAVASGGPISWKRREEIIKMTENVKSGRIFVSAFPDCDTFIKFAKDLAWETEVWLANSPNHMIHLNGNKFIGPQ